MDRPKDYILSEVSQKNIIWYYLCGTKKKKKDTTELIYKTEIDSQT